MNRITRHVLFTLIIFMKKNSCFNLIRSVYSSLRDELEANLKEIRGDGELRSSSNRWFPDR